MGRGGGEGAAGGGEGVGFGFGAAEVAHFGGVGRWKSCEREEGRKEGRVDEDEDE